MNNQYRTPDHRDWNLTFITPVAYTTDGIIVRGYESYHSKYLIIWSTTGASQSISRKTCKQIDEHISCNKLPDKLFTI